MQLQWSAVGAQWERSGSAVGAWSGQPRDNLGTTSGQPRDNPTSFLIKNGSFGSFFGLLKAKCRLDDYVPKQILTRNKDKCFWT